MLCCVILVCVSFLFLAFCHSRAVCVCVCFMLSSVIRNYKIIFVTKFLRTSLLPEIIRTLGVILKPDLLNN